MPPSNNLFRNKFLLTVYLAFLCGGLILPDFSSSKKTSGATFINTNPSIIPVPHSTAETEKISRKATLFEQNLPQGFSLPDANDLVACRILKDYGAVFVAQGSVVCPPKLIFTDEVDCANWQSQISFKHENFGGVNIVLQTEAMNALLAARKEAAGKNLQITARGTWAARRTYRDTEKIWRRRVVPGLAFWQRRGKLSAVDAARIRGLAPARQVKEILQLEARGLFFSKDFSKSILYSGTAPGASQHISMLALDINENNSAAVRSILARHGWFQTVVSDLPHFTYLGTTQAKLPTLGLKKTIKNNRIYWTPA